MPENRQVHSNAASIAPPEIHQVWKQKVRDNNEGEVARLPDRPGEPDCMYFLRNGTCGYGNKCRYNHPSYAVQGFSTKTDLPQRPGQPDCGFYLKTGTCKYGVSCRYHHPRDRNGAAPVYLNILGLPMRQEEKICAYYMRTGSCKFGAACKFHHPQPTFSGAVLPVSGTGAGGALGSSVASSSGVSYFGGLSNWSLPSSPFLSGTRAQGQQGYMPVMYSPTQGILPTQGWNTYLGNINLLSSAGILGPSVLYKSMSQTDLSSLSSFPERPDQPECRYFMSTGGCKFGSDCKFHHPKEKVAELANPANPHGLPSRPGQTVCANYNLYGLCKYGPTCKFDHPVSGYSCDYGLSLASLSMLDSSLPSYPRNSLGGHGSGASLSKSSKVSEWIKKSEQTQEINQETAAKTQENQTGRADSPTYSSPSSEFPPDHSD